MTLARAASSAGSHADGGACHVTGNTLVPAPPLLSVRQLPHRGAATASQFLMLSSIVLAMVGSDDYNKFTATAEKVGIIVWCYRITRRVSTATQLVA